jgi:hypothetical protein
MNEQKQVSHVIKWIGIEKILAGILNHIDELMLFSKEKYLKILYEDLTKALHNYQNRYKDVDRET